MNRLLCFITGGHRYSDANVQSTKQHRDNTVVLKNYCIKCGKIVSVSVDIDKIIAEDMKLIRGGNDDR